MKKFPTLITCLLLIFQQAFTQQVTTLVADFPGNDGLSIDAEGNIYVNDRGTNFNGTRVIKVLPDGTWSTYAASLDPFPVGSVFDEQGNLYVTGSIIGTISRINSDGTKDLIASGIPSAGGLERDNEGNLYCSAWSANQIIKVDTDNHKTVFASGDQVVGPAGLAFDKEEEVLYAANWFDTRLFRYTLDGDSEFVGDFPMLPIGPIVFQDGYIYASAPDAHRIFRMNVENGVVSTFAGRLEAGFVDGPLSEATFTRPHGLGFTTTGDTLYVSMDSPSDYGRLRRIDLTNATGLWEPWQLDFQWTITPCPSNGEIRLVATEVPIGIYTIQISDASGKMIHRDQIEVGAGGAMHWRVNLEERGIYSISLVAVDGKRMSKKVVVQ
ncbi:MAG: hypothetical protein DHS20C18_35330 [Saprospiraceae bacterium]|nr:MAG: hypothetical protein DHS20C18_35330 [Saprospiraceae bacterium]